MLGFLQTHLITLGVDDKSGLSSVNDKVQYIFYCTQCQKVEYDLNAFLQGQMWTSSTPGAKNNDTNNETYCISQWIYDIVLLEK